MEHSYRLVNNIREVFNNSNITNSEFNLNGITSIVNNNLLCRHFSFDVSPTVVEVPVLCFNAVREVMKYYHEPSLNTERFPVNPIVNIPLFEGSYTTTSAATVVINQAIRRGYKSGLCKVTTTKNIYYIGKGIIFDNNFKLLMLTTVMLVKLEGYPTPNIEKTILYVDPTVFTRGDIVSNFIIKKIIPIIHESTTTDLTDVVIKNMNHLLKTPVEPTVKDIEEKNISKFVKANAENITRELFNKILI